MRVGGVRENTRPGDCAGSLQRTVLSQAKLSLIHGKIQGISSILAPAGAFREAEPEHQDYLERNPHYPPERKLGRVGRALRSTRLRLHRASRAIWSRG